MQILVNFTKELNENPPPTDLMNIVPIQSNLIENEMTPMDFSTRTSPIFERSWGGAGDDDNIKRGRA